MWDRTLGWWCALSLTASPAVGKKMQAVSHRKENNSQQLMHDDKREAVEKEADAFHPTPEFSVAMPKEQQPLQSGASPLQCC